LRPPPAPTLAPADLLERVHVLRNDLQAQQTRAIAAVTRSASLRAARRAADEGGAAA